MCVSNEKFYFINIREKNFEDYLIWLCLGIEALLLLHIQAYVPKPHNKLNFENSFFHPVPKLEQLDFQKSIE